MFRLCPEEKEKGETRRRIAQEWRQERDGGFCFGRDYSDEDTFHELSEEAEIALILPRFETAARADG